ncbi:MAG: lipid-A-disaccharide synthase [Ottowia sp.]|nr:lipid-A-disaccharide synthase [Ottowia sp.]
MPAPLRIALVAGEPSGDLLASHLLAALRARYPDAEFFGIGGSRMQAQGFTSLFPFEALAVNGFIDALRHAPEILAIRARLRQSLLANPPDLFIGIDAPDFNLALETRLKAAGIPTVHFVSPSIWAWRGGRIQKIGAAVSHILCLFPCEPEIYQRADIPATYVGHPLADAFPIEPDRAAARAALHLPQDATLIALLPGSREAEVRALAPTYLAAARLLAQRRAGVQFIVPLATEATQQIFRQLVTQAQAEDLPLTLLSGQSHRVMQAADVIAVASGTASLEAALCKRPMVICYRVGAFMAHIYKRLLYLPWAGLPNILARETLVPELLQDDFRADKLADALEHWLNHPEACAELTRRFTALHHTLRQNTAETASAVIARLLPPRPQ